MLIGLEYLQEVIARAQHSVAEMVDLVSATFCEVEVVFVAFVHVPLSTIIPVWEVCYESNIEISRLHVWIMIAIEMGNIILKFRHIILDNSEIIDITCLAAAELVK